MSSKLRLIDKNGYLEANCPPLQICSKSTSNQFQICSFNVFLQLQYWNAVDLVCWKQCWNFDIGYCKSVDSTSGNLKYDVDLSTL